MRRRQCRTDRSNSNSADGALGFVPLLHRDKPAKVKLMGNSKGRDNAKKRARRRKKTERLALAKKAKAAN